jgi:cytochrome d ubiquinol oxidase subunit II
VIVSVVAGAGALALVAKGRFEPARYTAALAVAAIVAGWALAQEPQFLPGLTVEQAAAPHDTLVAVIVAVVGGGIIVFPSLALLLRLTLGGHLVAHHEGAEHPSTPPPADGMFPVDASRAARIAVACLVAGVGLLTAADAGWAHAIGVVMLFGFVAAGFLGAAPRLLPEREAS